MKKNSKFSHNLQNQLKTIFATIGVALVVFLSANQDHAATYVKQAVPDFKIAAEKSIADSMKLYTDSLELIKTDLITEVDDYIKKTSRRSKMTGSNIVEQCIEHNFDITLLMAQAHQETHFAAGGGRNNVFGLYNKRYKHPDQAVSDYINLMKRRYIINRTPEQLIASNFRMEYNHRAKYAGDPSYGKIIKKLRNSIINKTKIDFLFDRYMNLKNRIDSMDQIIIDEIIVVDSTKTFC